MRLAMSPVSMTMSMAPTGLPARTPLSEGKIVPGRVFISATMAAFTMWLSTLVPPRKAVRVMP